MKLELLDAQGLSALYSRRVTEDFPPSERKPLSAMLRLLDRGKYEPLLITQEDRPVGYALMWLLPDTQGALLEYFATLPAVRNQGLGSRILALLAQRYSHLIAESEEPEGPEDALKCRRLAFYQRNGFRLLNYRCALFGVPFRCLYRGPEPGDRAVEALHRGLYASYFSPAHMERYIQLPLGQNEAVLPAPQWVEELLPPPADVFLRPLEQEEISPALFSHFIRRQEVDLCWRRIDGRWTIRPDPFVDDWTSDDLSSLSRQLHAVHAAGGLVLGAFRGEELKAFASVDPHLFGGPNRYLDLTNLHVSRELRGRGLGRILFRAAQNWARGHGAKKLYLSAHSALETQLFYQSMGCVDALVPHPGHVAAEPFDRQLECSL